MAAEIKNAIGVDSELVRGRGGIFDVTVDGRKIYSKYDTGHFPTEKEIVEALQVLSRKS